MSAEEAEALVAEVQKRLKAAHENLKSSFAEPQKHPAERTPSGEAPAITSK